MTPEPRPENVASDATFTGTTSGAVTVDSGATLTVSGTHVGSIELLGGSALQVIGRFEGPLTVESLATATITGDVVGPVEVRVAGTLVIEASGRLAGSVTNFGSFTNRGLRVGRIEGRAPDDQEGSVEVPQVGGGPASYHLPDRG